MKKEIETVTMFTKDGEEVEVEIILDFEHKDKKYVVLYDSSCDECDHDFKCDCDDDCECHDGLDCDGNIYILEACKDEEGNPVYKEVDAKLMNELLPVIEAKLYPTEE